eukprot:GILK01004532.1.p3 GENE.GILK01004532.1~~GILK01004532.1.p3  ORF type:complete len:188 (-),score=14.60 GILK01004532.1:2561-3124(-)
MARLLVKQAKQCRQLRDCTTNPTCALTEWHAQATEQIDAKVEDAKFSPAAKAELKIFLHERLHRFASGKGRFPPPSHTVKHRVDTGGNRPVHKRGYRKSAKTEEIIETNVKDMLEQDVIEPSMSEWSAPVVLELMTRWRRLGEQACSPRLIAAVPARVGCSTSRGCPLDSQMHRPQCNVLWTLRSTV